LKGKIYRSPFYIDNGWLMGFVRVRVKIWNIENPGVVREVELLADTGAIYTVLPRSLLVDMGG